jgi:hypothetical protein
MWDSYDVDYDARSSTRKSPASVWMTRRMRSRKVTMMVPNKDPEESQSREEEQDHRKGALFI